MTSPADEPRELVTRPRRPRSSRLTPEQRSAQARVAALSRWSQVTDRAAETQAARDALAAKWDAAPNPAAARSLHMARMRMVAGRARTSTP